MKLAVLAAFAFAFANPVNATVVVDDSGTAEGFFTRWYGGAGKDTFVEVSFNRPLSITNLYLVSYETYNDECIVAPFTVESCGGNSADFYYSLVTNDNLNYSFSFSESHYEDPPFTAEQLAAGNYLSRRVFQDSTLSRIEVDVYDPDPYQYRVRISSPDARVPEPVTWALWFSGFGISGSAFRRHIRKSGRAQQASV